MVKVSILDQFCSWFILLDFTYNIWLFCFTSFYIIPNQFPKILKGIQSLQNEGFGTFANFGFFGYFYQRWLNLHFDQRKEKRFPPEDNFKKTLTEINFKIVEEKLFFSFSSKNANETDCIKQPGLKLSDITEINFKHDDKVKVKWNKSQFLHDFTNKNVSLFIFREIATHL